MPIKKVCDNCGETFSVPPSRKNTARFCSSKCKNEKRDWAKTKVDCVCEHCGNAFQIWGAWLRKDKNAGKYCSRLCKDEAQKRTDIPIDDIVSDYENGLSSVLISKKYDIPDTVIRRRLHEHGVTMRTAEEGIALAYKELRGPDNPNWKGGRQLKRNRKREKEYWLIYVPDHPRANNRGYVYEHIYVWEQANEKSVPKGWVVHHKNGISTDNRPENLQALTWSAHTKLHNDLREKELQDAKQRIKELEREIKRLENFNL